MKKLIALFMVLAMVFAVSGGTLADDNDQDSTGETNVKFMVEDSQISVTLPLNISVAVKASDGTITWPGSSSYKLVNKSAFAVKVSTISCAVTTGWSLASTPTGTDDISATVSPDEGTTKVNLLTTVQNCTGTAWNLAAVNDSNTDELALKLEGKINTPGAKTQALTTTATTAFTITYTVAAGANAA